MRRRSVDGISSSDCAPAFRAMGAAGRGDFVSRPSFRRSWCGPSHGLGGQYIVKAVAQAACPFDKRKRFGALFPSSFASVARATSRNVSRRIWSTMARLRSLHAAGKALTKSRRCPAAYDWIAYAIGTANAGYDEPSMTFATGLGCGIRHARRLFCSYDLDLTDPSSTVPIRADARWV